MLIFIFLILTGVVSSTSTETKRPINVGTVLFSERDCGKDCWTVDDIALLTSRMLLEDILPKKEVLVIQDNAFVTDLIDYFRLVLEVVRKLTHGKAKHIMLLALTDLLGGYLYRYVIPISKHAYYAGYLNFESIENLIQLHNELKCFLRTNGHGWAKPVTSFGNQLHAQPLPTPQPPNRKSEACKGLIYIENPGDSPNQKCSIIIPMPFFDSKSNPTAIAIPFKTYSLRNVESKAASYVLVKFYAAATKCLASRSSNQTNASEFNNDLFAWIQLQVIPHLSDDKFYSAFGGVFRLLETLKNSGAFVSDKRMMGNYNIMPETQVTDQVVKEVMKGSLNKQRKKSDMILMALLATIFVWFLLGSLFICYRIRASKGRNSKSGNLKILPSQNLKTRASSGSGANTYTTPIVLRPKKSMVTKKHSSSSQYSKNEKSSSTSDKVSPTGSGISASEAQLTLGSRHSESSIESARSSKSQKSNVEVQCRAPCAHGIKSEANEDSQCSVCAHNRSQSSKSSSSAGSKIIANPCLSDTRLAGPEDAGVTGSMEDVSLKNDHMIFNHDMDTSSSSETTPREQSEGDVEDYGAGNMSK